MSSSAAPEPPFYHTDKNGRKYKITFASRNDIDEMAELSVEGAPEALPFIMKSMINPENGEIIYKAFNPPLTRDQKKALTKQKLNAWFSDDEFRAFKAETTMPGHERPKIVGVEAFSWKTHNNTKEDEWEYALIKKVLGKEKEDHWCKSL